MMACTGGVDDAPEVREVASSGGSWVVSYAPDPDPVPFNALFALDVEVVGESAAEQLVVDATMPSHGHGMTTLPVATLEEDGAFRVEGLLFHMTGEWVLTVEVDGDEVASFDIWCCEA
jgi:hypothetical protein